MKIVLDFPEWTMGDIERLEAASGLSLRAVGQELTSPGGVSARTAIALVYAAAARTDPSYTLEQARAQKLGTLELEVPDPAPLDGSPQTGG